MRVASVYHLPEDLQLYYVVLDCACQYPVTEDMLTVSEFPCLLHEPWRYLGLAEPPAPSIFFDDDDDWTI